MPHRDPTFWLNIKKNENYTTVDIEVIFAWQCTVCLPHGRHGMLHPIAIIPIFASDFLQIQTPRFLGTGVKTFLFVLTRSSSSENL